MIEPMFTATPSARSRKYRLCRVAALPALPRLARASWWLHRSAVCSVLNRRYQPGVRRRLESLRVPVRHARHDRRRGRGSPCSDMGLFPRASGTAARASGVRMKSVSANRRNHRELPPARSPQGHRPPRCRPAHARHPTGTPTQPRPNPDTGTPRQPLVEPSRRCQAARPSGCSPNRTVRSTHGCAPR